LTAAPNKNRFSAAKNGLTHLKAFDKSLNLPPDKFFRETAARKKNRSVKPAKTIELETVHRKVNAIRDVRLKTAFRLMEKSGLRVSECAALTKRDIQIDGDGVIKIDVRHGKGGSNDVITAMPDEWLSGKLSKLLEPLDDGYELYDANEETMDFLRHKRFSTTKRYLRNRKLKIVRQGKRKYKKGLTNAAGSGIMGGDEGKTDMIEVEKNLFDAEAERRKILDGTYPLRIIQGRQNKHIEGTREFEQNCEKMNRLSPGSRPATLTADAAELVNKYKGTGLIKPSKGSPYPREVINTNTIIGKTWVKSLQKYIDTRQIKIIYSSTGVHVIPVSEYEKE